MARKQIKKKTTGATVARKRVVMRQQVRRLVRVTETVNKIEKGATGTDAISLRHAKHQRQQILKDVAKAKADLRQAVATRGQR